MATNDPLANTKPAGATIELKNSGGKTYWFDPTTKELYEPETKFVMPWGGGMAPAQSYTNYNKIDPGGSLYNDITTANWSKVGQYLAPSISDYVSQTATLDASGSLRYPSDMVLDNSSDYVLFEFYDYTPPFGPTSGGSTGTTATILNQTLNDYNSSVTEDATKAEMQQILLYMPDDVQDAYRSNWEGKQFGSITAGVLAAAGKDGTAAKLKSLAETGLNAGNRLAVNAAAAAVSTLAKSITGDSISNQDVFASVGGVIRNPNVELLFQSMSLRTFDLTFRMSPYYEKETKIIEDIISLFKQAMLPSYKADKGVFGIKNSATDAAFIKVPKLCLVQYMRGADPHPHLPKYKLCAITDMNVNFTPDNNYSTFSGGGPVSYELKLNFMETKLVFSEDWSSSKV